MLKKEYRIRKQKEFDKVFRQNKKITSENFQLLVRFVDEEEKNSNPELAYPRFAFVVSKKVDNRAVVRNTIKRRLRDIIKRVLPSLPPTYEIIVITYPQIGKCTYQELEKELLTALRKNKLLVEKGKKSQE